MPNEMLDWTIPVHNAYKNAYITNACGKALTCTNFGS